MALTTSKGRYQQITVGICDRVCGRVRRSMTSTKPLWPSDWRPGLWRRDHFDRNRLCSTECSDAR